MDRVNRRMSFLTALPSIPAALLMASLCCGASPEVQQAVGRGGDEPGAIQQVVGKQPQHRASRPGLLEVLTGSKPKGNQNHQHKNMPKSEPKGLLETLFDGSWNRESKQSQKSHNHNHNHNHKASSHNSAHAHASQSSANSRGTAGKSDSGEVNWNGIPFHSANASKKESRAEPIRDPRTRAASTPANTRIIRGGSRRPIQAIPASVRRPSVPTVARHPTGPLAVPEPPLDVEPIPRPSRSLSNSSSSRRNNRKSVQALDASEVAAASRIPSSAEADDDVEDLVPRVARKAIRKQATPAPATASVPVAAKANSATKPPAPSPTSTVARPTAAAAKPVASIARKPVPSKNIGATREPRSQVSPASQPVRSPETQTAIAAIGIPSATPPAALEPASSADLSLTPSIPSAVTVPANSAVTLPANTAASQPAYSTPVDPSNASAHPYAASTPASAASHRSGPPNGSFGMVPITANATPYETASAPVGSGVVPSTDAATHARESQPVYETAQRPTYGFDPYARQNSSSRISTYGQPSARPTPGAAHNSVATQPIQGYAGQPNAAIHAQPTADNFAPSTYQSRNQMRDQAAASANGAAASSELPGIRVATFGPNEIMIRQTNQYEIRVENRGSIDATGILVRAIVPDWADVRGQNATRGNVETQSQGNVERLVWTIDSLPAGASERMFVRLTAARSGTYDLDVDWTMLPRKNVARVQVHEPRLDLTIEGPDEVVYGKSQTYKVRVLNPGDGTASNVVFTLSPNSATPQTQRIGDIPPGKEAQFDVELTAQDLGDLKIHGLASGDLELRAESAKTIRVAAAHLEAVLTGPEVKYQNTDASYSLQLMNTGSASSEKIIATMRMPAGVKYLGGLEQAVVQGNALKWEINALAPGATRDYKFRCNMTSTGEHLFAFDCKGTAAGHTDVALATRVESIADLVLTVSDPPAPAPIGSDVTYEIVIRNRGSKEATDVIAIAQFSHGIEPQRIEGQSGEVVTGQVLFDPIPRIGAGQEVRLRIVAQADRAGHHRFRTEIRSGDTVLVAEEATHYMSPQSDRVSRRSGDSTTR